MAESEAARPVAVPDVMDNRPRRRSSDDHVHPEYWTSADHHRFEDRVSGEIHNLRDDVEAIGTRLTLLIGGLALLAFAIPLLVPLLQKLFGLPQ